MHACVRVCARVRACVRVCVRVRSGYRERELCVEQRRVAQHLIPSRARACVRLRRVSAYGILFVPVSLSARLPVRPSPALCVCAAEQACMRACAGGSAQLLHAEPAARADRNAVLRVPAAGVAHNGLTTGFKTGLRGGWAQTVQNGVEPV